MVYDDEINEIIEEPNIDEIESNVVNNLVPKPKEFGEFSRRNTHCIRLRDVSKGSITNFSFGFVQGKPRPLQKLVLS